MAYKDMKSQTLDNIQNLIQCLADELEVLDAMDNNGNDDDYCTLGDEVDKMTKNIGALRRASFRAYYIVCPELKPDKELK